MARLLTRAWSLALGPGLTASTFLAPPAGSTEAPATAPETADYVDGVVVGLDSGGSVTVPVPDGKEEAAASVYERQPGVKYAEPNYQQTWTDRVSRWRGWIDRGGSMPTMSTPAVASWSAGRVDVFYRGADSALWHRWMQQ